ncbi:MAG TPA: hypothetical protein VN843_11505 [Anaerolineales bacterium]|nr:hypothetical protein [Anaerolineales bacterium]
MDDSDSLLTRPETWEAIKTLNEIASKAWDQLEKPCDPTKLREQCVDTLKGYIESIKTNKPGLISYKITDLRIGDDPYVIHYTFIVEPGTPAYEAIKEIMNRE